MRKEINNEELNEMEIIREDDLEQVTGGVEHSGLLDNIFKIIGNDDKKKN